MLNDKILALLVRSLPVASVRHCASGSIYLTFKGCKVNQIRIANHSGHKAKAGNWELRTDASNSRKGLGRIYSAGSISQLINDFK